MTKLTTEERKKIHDWIKAQTYSGSSHQTHDQGNPAWLREDELQEYLPELISQILRGRGV